MNLLLSLHPDRTKNSVQILIVLKKFDCSSTLTQNDIKIIRWVQKNSFLFTNDLFAMASLA